MVQINFAAREVNCKIVYYGPGRCGKTTNLQVVHAKAPPNSTGELISIATEQDRTLFFDFLPLDLGTVAGMRTKFQLYTVPGQVYYDETRKLVLQGCDGVVFVADSNPEMMAENLESLENLAKNLKEKGLDLAEMPVVLQFNKRDLPGAVSVAEMNQKLNRYNWPNTEAIALTGEGVFNTLKIISQLVIRRLNRDQGYSDDGAKRAQAGKGGGLKAPPPALPAKPAAAAQAVQPVAPAALAVQPVAPQPEKAVPPTPPPSEPAVTKTMLVRRRIAELKKKDQEAKLAAELAAANAAPAGRLKKVARADPQAPRKKKGCFSLVLLGLAIVLLHWFSLH